MEKAFSGSSKLGLTTTRLLNLASFALLNACAPENPGAPSPQPPSPESEITPSVAFHALHLTEVAASSPAGTRWVRCLPSTLHHQDGAVSVCEDTPLGWLDPARDELVLDAHAHHADTLKSGRAEARFIGAKARLSLPLRPYFEALSAASIEGGIASFQLPVSFTHPQSSLEGQLSLQSIRAGLYLAYEVQAPEAKEGVLFVGKSLPSNENRPISALAWALVERPDLQAPAYCPQAERSGFAADLPSRFVAELLDRRTGESKGLIAEPLARCEAAPWSVSALQESLAQALASPSPLRPPEVSPLTALVAKAPLAPTARLEALEAPFGLSFGLTREALLERKFKVSGSNLRLNALEALLDAQGHLQELRLTRPIPEDPLGSLLGRPTAEVLTELGRPTALGLHNLGWIRVTGHWRYYLELACDDATCHTLRVGRAIGHDEHADGDVHPSSHSHHH